jgi:DNA polymerase (family 10)
MRDNERMAVAAAGTIENVDIARVFAGVADLLELEGANPFRVRAYRGAARTVETLGASCATLVRTDPKALERYPGIGKDLAGKIVEIVQTGELGLLRDLTTRLPEGLVEIVRLPGLGPKRAKQMFDSLGVRSVAELEAAARAGRLRTLPGLGVATEARILQAIADRRAAGGRVRLAEADAYVLPLLAYLRGAPGAAVVEVAGSYRRRCETVGDVDVLVATARPAEIARHFLAYPLVKDVLAGGATKCSVVLRSGLQVDLRLVGEKSFGAALHYFTGSRAHNVAIRTLGVQRGLKINEYGVFRGARRVGGRTEADVFEAVGLPWIPPELREHRGEIDAARRGRLPGLVELGQIRGDLHMHSTFTDGRNTIAEMVQGCRARGYAYMAMTDHTRAVRVAGGMDRDGFREQFHEIARVQKETPGIRILKGAEVDILTDGTLDLDDGTLSELDVVVASVHANLTLGRTEMTQRIVRALRHRRVQILGHPTSRILGKRPGFAVDMEAVINVAREEGVLLEINAHPNRLDLNDVHVAMARDAGVKLVISTDSHRVDELASMRFGVDQARRGWCEPGDIANTRSWGELRKLLR